MLKKINKKVEASALTITILVSTILLVLISAIVLHVFYFRNRLTESEIHSRLNANMESGINYVLGDSTHPQAGTKDFVALGSQADSVLVTRDYWGFFGLAAVQAYYGSFKKEKFFLYGSSLNNRMNSSIYLADHDRPLSLVGATRLVGDAYLPKAGIKTGYVNQRGFDYTKLLSGEIKKSATQLPPLGAVFYSRAHQLFDPSGETTNLSAYSTGAIFRSFAASPLVVESTEAINLDNIQIDGHVILYSDSAITITKHASLKNIILVAPVIRFEEGFKGTVQAFASDSLIVRDCYFEYPSALCVIKRTFEPLPPYMSAEKATINGLVFSLAPEGDKFKTIVNLKQTTVHGIVYCQGYLILDAKIAGCILSDYFIYRSANTVYENYLVDVEIDRHKLSKYFVGSVFFESVSSHKIVQWLN